MFVVFLDPVSDAKFLDGKILKEVGYIKRMSCQDFLKCCIYYDLWIFFFLDEKIFRFCL